MAPNIKVALTEEEKQCPIRRRSAVRRETPATASFLGQHRAFPSALHLVAAVANFATSPGGTIEQALDLFSSYLQYAPAEESAQGFPVTLPGHGLPLRSFPCLGYEAPPRCHSITLVRASGLRAVYVGWLPKEPAWRFIADSITVLVHHQPTKQLVCTHHVTGNDNPLPLLLLHHNDAWPLIQSISG